MEHLQKEISRDFDSWALDDVAQFRKLIDEPQMCWLYLKERDGPQTWERCDVDRVFLAMNEEYKHLLHVLDGDDDTRPEEYARAKKFCLKMHRLLLAQFTKQSKRKKIA